MSPADETPSVLSVPDLSGETIAGRFLIERPIAEGGMSRVFLAEQLDLRRPVALKVLKPPAGFENAQEETLWAVRFKREAAALAAVSHPNVVVVHEYGVTADGLAYLVMEHVDGVTLSHRVREGRLDGGSTVRIALQIASALEDAHRSGLVHRDLKPQNVMLVRGRSARVKVLDFGIVKDQRSAADDERTQEGIRVGSPRYMAPEQVSGDEISPATDVYALGCLMYFMLCGRPPFANKSAFEVMASQLRDPPPPLREAFPDVMVSAELEAVVMRCLEKKPKLRYPGMGELHDALEACPESSGDSSRNLPALGGRDATGAFAAVSGTFAAATASAESSPPIAAPDTSAKNRTIAAAVAGLAFFVLLVVVLAWQFGGGEEPVAVPATTSPANPVTSPAVGSATEPAAVAARPAPTPSTAVIPPSEGPAIPSSAAVGSELGSEGASADEATRARARVRTTSSRPTSDTVEPVPAPPPTVVEPEPPHPPPAATSTPPPATPTPTPPAAPGIGTDNLDPWAN